MAHYPMERRESVVRRMFNEGMPMSALARESGIAEATLYRWRDRAKTNGEAVSTPKHPEKYPAARKFAIVVEAASLNEAELAEFCRKKGLYPEQVKAWRAQAEQAMASGAASAKEWRAALTTEKKRNKELERELRRKEKALAETAALLTLRKKAAAIWGEGEDA
jgi:transposase-like protein